MYYVVDVSTNETVFKSHFYLLARIVSMIKENPKNEGKVSLAVFNEVGLVSWSNGSAFGDVVKKSHNRSMVSILTTLIVTIAVTGGFLLGCDCTIKSAVYVGPSYDLETKEPGYVISYRYGDYWTNHLYIEQ